MSDVVLDASAVLSVLFEEKGAERVIRHLPGAWISSVNLAEVMTKLADVGMQEESIEAVIDALQLVVLPFGAQEALWTARLRAATRELGLSLGDRACLATAWRQGLPALTADKAWTRIDEATGIRVELLR